MAVERSSDRAVRPKTTYVELIKTAITNHGGEGAALQDIYEAIQNAHSFFKPEGKGWKNSVRHTLSLNPSFQNVPRAEPLPGKGGLWRIDHTAPEVFTRKRNPKPKKPAQPTASTSGSGKGSSSSVPPTGKRARIGLSPQGGPEEQPSSSAALDRQQKGQGIYDDSAGRSWPTRSPRLEHNVSIYPLPTYGLYQQQPYLPLSAPVHPHSPSSGQRVDYLPPSFASSSSFGPSPHAHADFGPPLPPPPGLGPGGHREHEELGLAHYASPAGYAYPPHPDLGSSHFYPSNSRATHMYAHGGFPFPPPLLQHQHQQHYASAQLPPIPPNPALPPPPPPPPANQSPFAFPYQNPPHPPPAFDSHQQYQPRSASAHGQHPHQPSLHFGAVMPGAAGGGEDSGGTSSLSPGPSAQHMGHTRDFSFDGQYRSPQPQLFSPLDHGLPPPAPPLPPAPPHQDQQHCLSPPNIPSTYTQTQPSSSYTHSNSFHGSGANHLRHPSHAQSPAHAHQPPSHQHSTQLSFSTFTPQEHPETGSTWLPIPHVVQQHQQQPQQHQSLSPFGERVGGFDAPSLLPRPKQDADALSVDQGLPVKVEIPG